MMGFIETSPSPLAGEGGAKRRMRGRFRLHNARRDSLNHPLNRLAPAARSTFPRKGGKGGNKTAYLASNSYAKALHP